MDILSFQNILDAADITESTVEVPEWGGSVVVRSVSYRRLASLKEVVAVKRGVDPDEVADNDTDMEAGILAAGMVNPAVTEEQALQMLDKSASAIMKVLGAIMSSSKSDDEKAVVKEEKTFPPA